MEADYGFEDIEPQPLPDTFIEQHDRLSDVPEERSLASFGPETRYFSVEVDSCPVQGERFAMSWGLRANVQQVSLVHANWPSQKTLSFLDLSMNRSSTSVTSTK